jgi:hypothetical protein
MSQPAPPSPLPPSVEFYSYVGLCITAWAKVDEELFDILVDVLGTSRELGSIIYYRITSLGGRLGLVDELTLSVLPKPETRNGAHPHALALEWTALRKAVQALTSTRTQIAHHPVDRKIEFSYKDSGDAVPAGTAVPIHQTTWVDSYSIYVGQSERLRGKNGQNKPLTADSLSSHCQQVQAAATKLRQFRAASLVAHLASARV